MPLSEFHRMAGGRLEFSQQKSTSCSTDLTHFPEDEFVELVWENGQVMMQGQSSRGRRNMNSNNFQAQIPKFRDKDLGNATNSRMGKFGVMGSLLDDFTATVPSSDLGLDQDDEMAPWLNYDDPLQKSYCPDFLPELSTVTINELPASNIFSSIDKKNSINQTTGKANGVNSEHLSFERSHIPAPSLRPGLLSVVSNNVNHGDPTCAHASSSGFSNSNSAIINFAHFSRPVSHVRADIRNANTAGTPSSSAMGKMGCENEGTLATINNPFESRLDLINDVRKEKDTNSQPYLLPKLVNSRTTEKVETVFQENVVKIGEPPNQVHGTAPAHGIPGGEKVVEPVVASSSVCSGNNAEQASNDPMHDLKRKSRETDSEDRSEDVEEESVGIRKGGPARGGTGAKRSRAAEVHNLSERRRRDRINEKMRALQELIPNCNKVDKASMLDEAIEYLKTLQLQVQIMSMGAGLCMPPMMLPPGFQHVPAHMPHFLPMMGVGMGMGMGMGLGMGMQGAHFHGPRAVPFSGPANFQMMAGPNLQVFGHGGPALNMSAPRGPSVPLSGGPSMKFAGEGVNAFGMAACLDVPCSGPLSGFKDLMQQNTNSEVMHNVEACSSMNQVSGQCQVTHDGFEHSSMACKNDGSTRSR